MRMSTKVAIGIVALGSMKALAEVPMWALAAILVYAMSWVYDLVAESARRPVHF